LQPKLNGYAPVAPRAPQPPKTAAERMAAPAAPNANARTFPNVYARASGVAPRPPFMGGVIMRMEDPNKPPQKPIDYSNIDPSLKNQLPFTPHGSQKGRAKNKIDTVRPPRDRSSDRPLQFLTQLSFVIFSAVKSIVTKEQEVQCMGLGGKLVITANEAKSVQALENIAKELSSSSFVEAIIDKANLEDKTLPMIGRKVEKFYSATLTDTKRTGYIDEEMAELVRSKIGEVVQSVSGIDACVEAVKKPGKKILLLSAGAYHAEQNFALVLAKCNGVVGGLYIAGKKRPCVSCYLTLKLLKEKWNIAVDYIRRPGHYFKRANAGLWALLELGIEQHKFTPEEAKMWFDLNVSQIETHTTQKKNYEGKKKPSEKGDTGIESESESEDEEAKRRFKERGKKRELEPTEKQLNNTAKNKERDEKRLKEDKEDK
jgi:hypothetical protein